MYRRRCAESADGAAVVLLLQMSAGHVPPFGPSSPKGRAVKMQFG